MTPDKQRDLILSRIATSRKRSAAIVAGAEYNAARQKLKDLGEHPSWDGEILNALEERDHTWTRQLLEGKK